MPKGKAAQEIVGGAAGKSFRPRRGRTSFPGRTPEELAVRTFPLAFSFTSWLNFELLMLVSGPAGVPEMRQKKQKKA
jgi:hypothetical protein